MTAAKKPSYAGAPAALTITTDEVAELEAPFVIDIGGKVGALKGSGSFSIDDYYKVQETVGDDPRAAIDLVAYDEASAALLRGIGHKALQLILVAWFKTEGVTPGESERSES